MKTSQLTLLAVAAAAVTGGYLGISHNPEVYVSSTSTTRVFPHVPDHVWESCEGATDNVCAWVQYAGTHDDYPDDFVFTPGFLYHQEEDGEVIAREITESDPEWDCQHMGNRLCGPQS